MQELKMAAIAGASHALKYKEKHRGSSDEEAIRAVSKDVREILDKIDEED